MIGGWNLCNNDNLNGGADYDLGVPVPLKGVLGLDNDNLDGGPDYGLGVPLPLEGVLGHPPGGEERRAHSRGHHQGYHCQVLGHPSRGQERQDHSRRHH